MILFLTLLLGTYRERFQVRVGLITLDRLWCNLRGKSCVVRTEIGGVNNKITHFRV